MDAGWKRSWKIIPSLKGSKARCGFILQPAPTVRLVMLERQDLPPSCLGALESGNVELQRQPQDLRAGGTLRHAKRFQRPLRDGEYHLWRRSQERGAFRFQQSPAHPNQDSLLGRER